MSLSSGRINALTSTIDGPLWFVEDEQQIFTIDINGTVNRISRQSRMDRGRVNGLALDPLFRKTGLVYVQEFERLRDGGRELKIFRYREVGGTLRERASIVSGIRIPPTGSVPFTVDDGGRIFVAIPGDARSPAAQAGVVLAFQSDGKYVRTPSGAPLLWRGLTNPTDLIWDAIRAELWLSGADGPGTSMVVRLALNSLQHDDENGADLSNLLLSAPGGQLLQIDRHTGRAEVVTLGTGEQVTAVTTSGREVAFAATHSKASGSRILAVPVSD